MAPNLEVLMNLEGKNLVVGNHDKGVEESKKFLCDSIHARWNVQKEKKIRWWVW